jgi:ABC-2 type transport system ATP-binding protein
VASFGAHDAGMNLKDNPNAPSAIKAERLVRQFDGLTAVDEVDLDIGRGEIYGFLGPNGAGKSTTVRVLCTLLSPTAGRAVVAGYDVATQPDKVRLRIGVALQEAALDAKQTGIQLLRLQGRLYGLTSSEIEKRLGELGRLIDIGDALGRPIATYSGGMKRRLDLAAALVHNPEVLFLDEPTSGLDPVSRARMWEEVRRLNRELNMTIFLTTQYLEEADELADRVGIINNGRLVAEGTPDELKRSVGNDVIVARVDGSASAARGAVEVVPGVHGVETRGDQMIVTAADGAATIGAVAVALNTVAPVRHLTLRTPTLDDVFLELTGNHIQSDEGDDGPSGPSGKGEPTQREVAEVGR